MPEGQSRKREFIESAAFQELTSQARIVRNVREFQGKHIGFFMEFDTEAGEEVLLKSGISYVSESGAELNLKKRLLTGILKRYGSRHGISGRWPCRR